MKYSSSALAYAALAAQGASAFPKFGSAELENFKRQAADDHHWQPAGPGDGECNPLPPCRFTKILTSQSAPHAPA